MKISVVVPTYNRALPLQQCLESLTKQTLSVNEYEVIVVDDGSTDNTHAEYSRQAFPKSFRFIQQHHEGAAAARNLGASEAKHDIILFFDDDVVADNNLLSAHVDAHKKWESAAVFGFTPFAIDLPKSPIMEYHRRRWDNIFKEVQQFQAQGEVPFNYFITLNLSVLRTDFEAIGPFNTALKVVFEDTELGLRFSHAGIPIQFSPEALAWHKPELDEKSLTERQEIFGYRAGCFYMAQPNNIAMNECMKVEYVMGYGKNRPLKARFREWVRHTFLRENSAMLLLFFGTRNSPLIPERVGHYFLNLVSGYYYSKGFRNALENKNVE